MTIPAPGDPSIGGSSEVPGTRAPSTGELADLEAELARLEQELEDLEASDAAEHHD